MPNCFQLYRKTPDGTEKTATPLQTVDVELCSLLGVDVHPEFYVAGWYNVIGFLIAVKSGCSLGSEKLRDELLRWFDDDGPTLPENHSDRFCALVDCLDYLEKNYASDCWVQIGR